MTIAQITDAMNHAASTQATGSHSSRLLLSITFVILSLGVRPITQGAVIYSGLLDIPITTTFDGTYLDVDTGLSSSSSFSGWDLNPFFGGYGISNSADFQPVRASTGSMSAVLNLPAVMWVDSLLNYATGEAGSDSHMGTGVNQFQSGVDGYLGFRFTTNSSAGPYFGWMRVSLTYNAGGAVIRDWAYDDAGMGLNVGSTSSVPEPGRAILLTIGLAMLTWRRRRLSDASVAC